MQLLEEVLGVDKRLLTQSSLGVSSAFGSSLSHDLAEGRHPHSFKISSYAETRRTHADVIQTLGFWDGLVVVGILVRVWQLVEDIRHPPAGARQHLLSACHAIYSGPSCHCGRIRATHLPFFALYTVSSMSRHAVQSGSSRPVPSSRLPGYVTGTGLGGDDGRPREFDLRGMIGLGFVVVNARWMDGKWREARVEDINENARATAPETEANYAHRLVIACDRPTRAPLLHRYQTSSAC